jgi:hypothetical protein
MERANVVSVRKTAVCLFCALLLLAMMPFGTTGRASARETGYVLFEEDFGDGLASAWMTYNGTWSVIASGGSQWLKTTAANPAAEAIVLAGDGGWTNYTVEMDVHYEHIANPGGTAASGLIARFADYNNFYLFRLNQNGNAELMKKSGGAYSLLASAPYSLSAGQTYTLSLTLEDDELTGSVNGNPILSVSDHDVNAGKIGFRAYGQTVRFTGVKVTADHDPSIVDKTELGEWITTTGKLQSGSYMPAGWSQLTGALALAQTVFDDEDATQSDVNQAIETLKYAIRNLATLPGHLPDGIEKVPYRMDGLNQAGWWIPLRWQDGITFMAYNEPSVREGNHHIAVAVRNGEGNWSKLPAMNGTARAEYVDDLGHNQPSIAMDGDGNLHMFASMHNDTWRYFVSDWDSHTMQNHSIMMPDQGDLLTYPVVAGAPDGDVWLIIRSVAGDRRVGKLYRFDNDNKTWTREAIFASAAGRSVYPDDLLIDENGHVHILFEWAPNPAAAVRHELSYVKYNPSTQTFHKADGSVINGPVTPSTADVIQPLTAGEAYNDQYGVQSAKFVLDEQDRPMVAYRYHSSDNPASYAVKFSRFTGSGWQTETVYHSTETRATIDITHHGSETRIYYVLTEGLDRVRVAVRDDNGWTHATIAPGIPVNRLSVETAGNGIDVLYLADIDNEALYYGEFAGLEAPAGPGLPFVDDFENGMDNWTILNGTWQVASVNGSMHLLQLNVNGESLAYAGNPQWTDYVVEAEITLNDIRPNAASGLLARYTDAQNYYMLRLHETGELQLYKKVNGTFTLIESKPVSVGAGMTRTLKLSLDGNVLTAYVDGVMQFAATDNALSQGAIGVRSYHQSIAVDDVVVQAISD